MKNSALKDSVKNTQQLRLTGYDAMKAAQGSPASVAKPLLDTYRTKAQEAVALSKGDGLLNTLGKVGEVTGKYLPGALGVGGAVLGAMSAANAGELSPEEATVAGALDAVNPTPTDVVQAAVEGKKAAKQALAEGASPYVEEIADPTSLTGVRQGNEVMDKALLAGAKGLVSPIPNLAKAAVDTADSFGTSQSNEARNRMEQQMNALNSLKSQPEKKGNDFLNFVNKNPQSLKDLAGQLTGAGQSYAAPLNKAADADERTRTAILYGLYQQPAFRQLLGADSALINENIPGVKKSAK
jgi:hypothetical protein